jgi:hypothetical protein
MKPGTLCEDTQFIYRDGQTGKKILIVLNDGSAGYYVVIKTTSRDRYKGISYGCQSSDRYPNFFLPKGSCCLSKDTWAMLDDFFEFKAQELLAKHFSGQIRRIGILPDKIIEELLRCAANCDDVTTSQTTILQQMLDMLRNTGGSSP